MIYFTIGVVFHLIGGISGIIRASYIEDIDELDATRSEFKIGVLLLGNSVSYILFEIIFLSCFDVLNLLSFFSANFVVLFCEAAYLGYAEFSKKNESTASN